MVVEENIGVGHAAYVRITIPPTTTTSTTALKYKNLGKRFN